MPHRIEICDNTLREGEQVPGVFFTREEKTALFRALDDAGVDLIDVGIPAASREDADFCGECVKLARNATPGASIRALPAELDLAHDLGLEEVYLMFPFSEIHIRHKFGLSVETIKERCRDILSHAGKKGLGVNLVAEDASRGGADLVGELSRFAARRGIRRLILCDTVGAAFPLRFSKLVSEVVDAVEGLCPVGVHCHDDYGLATANTLAAVEAGAQLVSVTLNGLGERAGNAPLHEVALGLDQLLGVDHGLRLDRLMSLSRMAEEFSGIFLSPLSPIVGRNAFRHESGIHVNGLLKQPRVYEELKPETVGREREHVLGAGTGSGHLRALLAGGERDWSEKELRALREALRVETRKRDKTPLKAMRKTLEDYYRENFSFSTERFQELVERVLGREGDEK